MKIMSDETLIRQLIPLWRAYRQWANTLLESCLGLERAEDILEHSHRGRKSIPGTNWIYRTHGVGVDIYRTETAGGIDFDFNKLEPDTWRLRIFAEKQFNDGNLCYESYRNLIDDEERFIAAAKAVLGENTVTS
jgi:hypothetical protein